MLEKFPGGVKGSVVQFSVNKFFSDKMLFNLISCFIDSRVKCFSYPLTHDVWFNSLTLSEAYENFLDPMKDNIEYQAKKPGAVR